jgi:hypothetical protein
MRVSVAACAIGAGAALALTACGSSATSSSSSASSSPTRTTNQLVSQVKAAVKGASSVHLNGQIVSGSASTGVNLGLLRSGELSGFVAHNGRPVQVIGTKNKVYVKTTAALLRQLNVPDSVCTIICGKFLQLPAGQASSITGDLSLSNLTNSIAGKQPAFTQQGRTTVNGQSAIVLRSANGSTLDVAANGKPYPLRAVSTGTHKGTLTFTQWNKVPTPTAPPAGQVVNVNQLKAGIS